MNERKNQQKTLLYIVDSDRSFLDEIEREQDLWGIQLMTESDPDKAKEKLGESKFNPHFVIVAQSFRASKVNGFDLINAANAKKNNSIFGMILESEELKERQEAMRKGASLIFTKPVPADTVVRAVKGLLQIEHMENYKVLIVAEDVATNKLLLQTAKELGMDAKSIENPRKIFESIDSFLPHMLLIDISKSSEGEEFLKALCSDRDHQQMTTIVIADKQENSISSDVDEIIYQPLDPSMVKARISSIAKLSIAREQYLEKDEITGLSNKNMLLEQLYQTLTHAGKRQQEQFVALLEIEKTSRHMLTEFGNLMAQQLLSKGFCASVEEGIFAFIPMPENRETIKNLLDHFLEKAKAHKINAHCGMTALPNHYVHPSTVLKSAYTALIRSKTEREIAITNDLVGTKEEPTKMEIALIDSNPDLLYILTSGFKAHGFSVTAYTTGQSFIDDLIDKRKNPPSLVISERLLPDMDGLNLIKKIYRQYPAHLPWIFLTTLSADKDVCEGLHAGALDYMAKPFNLNVLLEKVNGALKVETR